MFEHVEPFSGDPILSLVETFNADPRSDKVNLSIGIYYDENGKIPTLRSVLSAEETIPSRSSMSPSYLPMEGNSAYCDGVQALLFGENSTALACRRVATVQTIGGSGALKVGADFLRRYFPSSQVWVSDNTWDNHVGIFEGAGFAVNRYRYFDPKTKSVDFSGLLADLDALRDESIVILHPCCHNPTGADLTPAQWDQLVSVIQHRNLVPFLDIAYQGFGEGIEEDAYAIRALASAGVSFFVSNSFSKIFSLYNERVGALSVVCADAAEADRVHGQLKSTIRTNYSSPPATGARLVAAILANSTLRDIWRRDVDDMRNRINGMRRALRTAMETNAPDENFSYLTLQRGMFSFTGLNRDQVNVLRDDWGVYLIGNGRLCLAGLTPHNIPRVAEALTSVL
jgi:aromatic-amino-acid transaminase